MDDQLTQNKQIITPPMGNVSVVNASKTKSSLLHIIGLIIIILIILGIVSYFFITGNSKKLTNDKQAANNMQSTKIDVSPSFGQSSVTINQVTKIPTITPISNSNNGWQTFTDPQTHISVQYPPTWTMQTINSGAGLILQGPQGTINAQWAQSGFGGVCGSQQFESVQIFNQQVNSCYSVQSNGSDTYGLIWPKLPNLNFSASAIVNPPNNAANGITVFKILSTFRLTTPAASGWKTYTNSQYGFQITYPSEGIVMSNGCFGLDSKQCTYNLNTCGNDIHFDDQYQPVNDRLLVVDNFFSVWITPISMSLSDYIKQMDPQQVYVYQTITGSNADEAVQIIGLKPSVQLNGPPPFPYIFSLYKKGNDLFSIRKLQNDGGVGGCVIGCSWPQQIGEQSSYNVSQQQCSSVQQQFVSWNIPLSFKFIN